MHTFFSTHPVFRLDELESCKNKQCPVKDSTVHTAVNYYIQTGKMKRLRRELFGVIPPGVSAENIQFDRYLVAGKVVKDSVLAYHTALELHGLAYAVFEQMTFLTLSKIKPFEFEDSWFKPVRVPQALLRNEQANFGVEQISRQSLKIAVTSIERTFVDILDRPDLCGGWEEVSRAINSITALNEGVVLDYCQLLDKRVLNAKVGFFLEQREGAFAPKSETIAALLSNIPKSAKYLTQYKNERHVQVNKWNLIVPVSILQQSWNEPNNDI